MEDLFRDALSGAEVIPGSGARQSLFRKVALKEFVRFNPARFNIYYAAAMAAVLTAGILLSTNRNDVNLPEPGIRQNSSESVSDTVTLFSTKPAQKPQSKAVTQKKADAGLKVRNDGSGEAGLAPVEKSSSITGDSISKKKPSGSFADRRETARVRTNPSASFILSGTEGCVPFKIKFRNTSAPFDSCRWIIGDTGISHEAEPEWTFEKPGVYQVTLKVYSNNGLLSSKSEHITAHSFPEVRFEAAAVDDGSEYNMVRFVNYTTGAVKYNWDFGDGNGSSAIEPVHRFAKQGNYKIRLTAWSDKGCSGTSELVYKTGSKGFSITFPNAFIPNRMGPTGGHYSAASDETAHVFHPEGSGVADYRLRIYTRTGLLLFESNDLNIGWDGYYKGNLCEPGVYVWRASGRFKNGEPFSRMGDVTIIRRSN